MLSCVQMIPASQSFMCVIPSQAICLYINHGHTPSIYPSISIGALSHASKGHAVRTKQHITPSRYVSQLTHRQISPHHISSQPDGQSASQPATSSPPDRCAMIDLPLLLSSGLIRLTAKPTEYCVTYRHQHSTPPNPRDNIDSLN
mmetsp:Transcript_12803/g.37188  ORF Transcript_12803/g.37188 Transcript_12803/m.37188 type:complete len:145 (+) Transcript_12803:2-436(+)